jgi:hypothetical protein
MRNLLATVSIATLVLLAAPAAAQEPWSARGELTDADGQDEGHHRYDEHRFRLEAGQRYRISVDSAAFDPVARLYRVGTAQPVAENDDAAGLNSRISYTPPESGDYVLRVVAFSEDGRGAYTAGVAPQAPLPPPVTAPGQIVTTNGAWALWEGALAESDPEAGGHHFDDYLIHVDAGQRRYISLEAAGFDTMVQVMQASARDNDSPETVDQDDDTGAGLNSFLVFAPAEAGDYIVRVTSFGDNATGAYRLWISQ